MRGQSKSHFSAEQWATSLAVATQFLQERAAEPSPNNMTYYQEVCDEIRRRGGADFDPDSNALAELLGEISTAEFRARRGMLTAIVVHKTGDMEPGKGFKVCSQDLGLPVRDIQAVWIGQMNQVHAFWRGEAERLAGAGQ